MRERIPIGVQLLALICLGGVWLTIAMWVERRGYSWPLVAGSPWSVNDIVHGVIPLTIFFLGVRFTCRFGPRHKTVLETVFYSIGVILTLAALLVALMRPPVQRVREAASYATAERRSARDSVHFALSSVVISSVSKSFFEA